MQIQGKACRAPGRVTVQLPRATCNNFRSAVSSSKMALRSNVSRLSVVAQAVEGETNCAFVSV